jgi:hypothetical protein
MKSIRIPALVIALTVLLASAAHAQGFVINLIMPDKTVLIYSVDNGKPKVGDKLTVVHAGRKTGTVEVTADKGAFVMGKISEQTGEVAEGDALEGATAAPAGEKKTEPAKPAPAKPAEKKTEPAKKPDAKKPAAPPAEKKVAAATTPAKTESKPAAKSAGKPEQPAAEAPKPKGPHPDSVRPGGFTGLFSAISAEMQPDHKGAFALTYARYKGDYFVMHDVNFPAKGSRDTLYSITYGMGDHMELAVSREKLDLPFELLDGSLSGSVKETMIGLKYGFQKKFLLKGNTHKKIKYAVGITRSHMSSSDTALMDSVRAIGVTNTMFYGAATMHWQKLTWHFDTYRNSHSFDNARGKKKWGSTLGVDAPLRKNFSIIGDVDRYQGDYVYSAGLRWYFNDEGSAIFGWQDIGNTEQLTFSASYGF